jgi:antitoxin component YwqK of YwqJK toxin-antitoxin module
MKKAILFTLSFVLSASFCFAQQINQTDVQGRKQGHWEKTYSNGAIRYKGQFKDNHPYGEFRYYFPTGHVSAISVYSDNGTVAHTKTFHLNGKPMAEGKFVNRKKDSTWNFFSDVDGKLVAKEDYLNDKKNGKAIVYYASSGKPAEITHYKNGVKDGEWVKYFPDDSVYIRGYYKNDTLEGLYKVYGIDGHIEIEGNYLKGTQNGTWITYDSTGKVLYKQLFKRGALIKQTK